MKKRFLVCLAICHTLFADFSSDLVQKVGHLDENWVFSPYSISSCLLMVQEGARGQTAEEMKGALKQEHFSDWSHKSQFATDFELNVAQGAWIKEGFEILPSYRSTLEQTYRAAIENVPFNLETVTQINRWIEQATHDRIKNLLSPSHLTPNTRLLLANALYFHGSWERPFQPKATADAPFYSTPAHPKIVPFMEQKNSFLYLENNDCQAVILPLVSADKVKCDPICLFLLPQKGDLPLESIGALIDSAQPTQVKVRLPKFTIEKELDLVDPFIELGMRRLFSPLADLSGINGKRDLYLNQVLHKAFFSLDEKGIEATAATVVQVRCTTAAPDFLPTKVFTADRPFYFILLEKNTKTIFFIGHIQTL